ncbi:hypothetical protein [Bradyrhizobium sp. DOA1]|uniref:hypothetical protein n=1 Tax=Bradyrhizobium sp. DOA1 TaxID=1126616 RepID=UPI00077C9A3C|nr:hypothetical protein [Bradyrhizobium sp. DOA1]
MSAVSYIICGTAIGSCEHVPSTKAEYDSCVSAVGGIDEITAVEENYESLIENYVEWESAISQHTLQQMISFRADYDQLQAARKLIARRLANLLTSARLYLDTLPKAIKKIFAADDAAEMEAKVKQETNLQYDACLAYRVMEALRNYAQHAALPIHGVTTHALWDRVDQPTSMTFAVLPTVDRERLAQDGQFKKSVLLEISQLGQIEFKPMVREYIEGVSAVHDKFRKMTDSKRRAWVAQLATSEARFTSCVPNPQYPAPLSILPIDEDGTQAGEPVYISGPMVEYLEHMQKKYFTMVNFAKRRVDF